MWRATPLSFRLAQGGLQTSGQGGLLLIKPKAVVTLDVYPLRLDDRQPEELSSKTGSRGKAHARFNRYSPDETR